MSCVCREVTQNEKLAQSRGRSRGVQAPPPSLSLILQQILWPKNWPNIPKIGLPWGHTHKPTLPLYPDPGFAPAKLGKDVDSAFSITQAPAKVFLP